MKLGIEDIEQSLFCSWLDSKGFFYSSIPNSTYCGWNAKRKNKATGLHAGLPDLLVIGTCWDGKKRIVFIEMKKPKIEGKRGGKIGGGKVSENQKEWIEKLNECESVGAYVCFGFEEAKARIKEFL